MAEFNSAENLNMNLAENLSTDVMTGGLDERMFLYFRLSGSMKKAGGVDIIVSFLMESGVKMILKDLDQALQRGAKIRILTGNYLGITQPSAFEYSCAMKSHFRKSGNQMSGKWKSSYASLLA